MNTISTNFLGVLEKIRQAEQRFQRPLDSVKLLAVSKGQPIQKISALAMDGQRLFGESYCQEAIGKIHAIKNSSIEWHFIGNIQSNKTKLIAENFAWVQSLSRLSIAERLNKQRPAHLPVLNVCIEVNISDESSKSGVLERELYELAMAVRVLPRIKLRGLMIIPAPGIDFTQQLQVYQKADNLYQELIKKGFDLDTLSMGMTNDFEAAIAAGSTMVRIGTGLFGERL